LLNCMAGLDSWDEGSVILDGHDLATLNDDQRALLRRSQIGFVFQAFHVLPHLDVAQNVALPLMLLGQPDDVRVESMLRAVGLDGFGPRLPAQLSRGGHPHGSPSRVRWPPAPPRCWPTSRPATSIRGRLPR